MAQILYLGSNARNTARLRLDAEVRDIEDELARNGAGATFEIRPKLAVRREDVQRHLLKHRPEVLHFSGHGQRAASAAADEDEPERASGTHRELLSLEDDEAEPVEGDAGGRLIVEDERGVAVPIPPEALTELFAIVREEGVPLRCAVLNACFSADQARAIAEHVDCVVGMKHAIDDRSAIAFAVAFYRALALGFSVATAFRLGRNEIKMRGLPDKDAPALFHREGVKPGSVFLSEKHLSGLTGVVALGRAALLDPLRVRRVRRIVAGALLSALVIAVAAVAMWRLAPAPTLRVLAAVGAGPNYARFKLALLPLAVEPAVNDGGTIVVAGPWVAAPAGRSARGALCEALDEARREGEPSAICLDIPPDANDEGVIEQALAARVSLAVVVNSKGSAAIRMLGEVAETKAFKEGLPRVDLSRLEEDRTRALASILRSLAHIADGAGRTDRIRCPTIEKDMPGSLWTLSLLVEMYAHSCQQSAIDAKELLGKCVGEHDSSPECKLARFLHERRDPTGPDAKALLEEIRAAQVDSPESAARVLSAGSRACRKDWPDIAEQAADRLRGSAVACVRMTASIPAACVMARRGKKTGEVPDWVRDVERFPEEIGSRDCPDPLRGSVLGQRAFWRAVAARWQEAEEDYRNAYNLLPNPLYALNRVEVILHQGKDRTRDAMDVLASLRDHALSDRERVQRALLSWIAERHAGDPTRSELAGDQLVDSFRGYPEGAQVYEDAMDPVLRPLACPDSGGQCALSVLAFPKTSKSLDRLVQALADASQPPTPSTPPR